ncbi:MAG: hypothetical protein ACYTFG_06270 [Planctomycetota bacterium]|jgi:hypothetical protein
MNDDVIEISRRSNFRWVKGDSGVTYLCPVKDGEWWGGTADSRLRRVCVDESDNPHND